MKKKYIKPQIESITLDRDIVLLSVSEPDCGDGYQHRHRHGHNVQADNVRENAFGGNSPFPDEPQY